MARTLADGESNSKLAEQYPNMTLVSYGGRRIHFVSRARQVVFEVIKKSGERGEPRGFSVRDLFDDKKLNNYVEDALHALAVEEYEKNLEQEDNDDQEHSYMEEQARLFEEAKEELSKSYLGKYVLFEYGKILDSGDSRSSIAMRAYKEHGMKPLFIEKVMPNPPKRFIWTPIPSFKKRTET